MKKYLLSICIPTFNCKERIITIVNRYLQIPDDRFCIKIVDNKSTDGTYEALASISDSRLFVSQNPSNIGFQKNSIKALVNAPAKYILYSIDKDYFSEQYLSIFIDYLVSDNPFFGYIALKYNPFEKTKSTYKAGIDAVLNSGAFISRHPTGFYFRSDLFDNEISKDIYSQLDPYFAFPFDMVYGSFACKHDVTLYNIPLTIHPDELIKTTKTITYNEDNFFFSAKYRIIAYRYYLYILFESILTKTEKYQITSVLFYRLLIDVSIGLNSFYNDNLVCEHYNLRQREIGICEMLKNTLLATKTHKNICKECHIKWLTRDTIHTIKTVNVKIIKYLIKRIWNHLK